MQFHVHPTNTNTPYMIPWSFKGHFELHYYFNFRCNQVQANNVVCMTSQLVNTSKSKQIYPQNKYLEITIFTTAIYIIY